MALFRTNITFIILFIAISSGFAQLDQGGFISPGDSLRELYPYKRVIFLPQDGFTFYNVPNGAFKGKILPGPPLGQIVDETEIDTLLMSTIVGVSIRPKMISTNSYFETSGELYHLSFSQQKDDFVFVSGEDYQGWISLEEIKKKGFRLISWMQFYGEANGLKIHPVEKFAPIRIKPSSDAKIIETADELYSEISTTGKIEGIFCYVKVTQYRNPYDPSKSKEENILKKYKGWIQVIDENGKSLVAHNSSGE